MKELGWFLTRPPRSSLLGPPEGAEQGPPRYYKGDGETFLAMRKEERMFDRSGTLRAVVSMHDSENLVLVIDDAIEDEKEKRVRGTLKHTANCYEALKRLEGQRVSWMQGVESCGVVIDVLHCEPDPEVELELEDGVRRGENGLYVFIDRRVNL